MKRLLLLCIACLAGFFSAKAQVVDPRLPDGRDFNELPGFFHQKMAEVMVRDGYKINELSKEAVLTFTVDTLGNCVNAAFPLSYEGETYFPTERSKELVLTTLSEIGPLCPAELEGRKILFNVALNIEFTLLPGGVVPPSYKGNGENSINALCNYVLGRIQLHEGMLQETYVTRVEFIVDRNGEISLGRVLESSDPVMTRQVQRAILKTSGKWTPGYIMGVPVRITQVLPLRISPQGPPPETFDDIKLY